MRAAELLLYGISHARCVSFYQKYIYLSIYLDVKVQGRGVGGFEPEVAK